MEIQLTFLWLFCHLPFLLATDEFPVVISSDFDKAIYIVPHQGCKLETDSVRSEKATHVYKVDPKTFESLYALCVKFRNETIDASEFIGGLRDHAIFIYPGTKWCGAGNSAQNETDLGTHELTDSCCREHDSCPNYLEAFSCHDEFGLCNKSPFTRSHCACDEKFRRCLMKANETAGNRVGMLYFTVFGLKCFRNDYPIVKCKEYGGFLNIHCQKYILDQEKEKAYQFFDSPKYNKTASIESIPELDEFNEIIVDSN